MPLNVSASCMHCFVIEAIGTLKVNCAPRKERQTKLWDKAS